MGDNWAAIMTLKFRVASPEDDVLHLCDLGFQCGLDSPYSQWYDNPDDQGIIRYVQELVKGEHMNKCMFVAYHNDNLIGLIIGAIGDIPFTDKRIAMEEIWYVEPHPLRTQAMLGLVKIWEDWATANGCVATLLGTYDTRFTDLVKKKKGYDHMNYRLWRKTGV